ncbi:MAG: preprotein translocase subunit SecE [Holophaga sp.]|nr:preprotein translocase subunit SecE [Holophaga sp.]
MISAIKQQTKDLFAELNRVDWPGKEKVMSSTGAVIFVSVFVGLFLYVADLVITWGMKFILPHH